ncbi:MAG: single-stranded-DNA-specific exonuclease RecJ [Rhodanobacteraceae bacterium]
MIRALTVIRRKSGSEPYGWPDHVHPVLRQLYAARGALCPDDLGHRLAGLLPPQSLSGIDRATELLADAIACQQSIVIAADFDCDGATGAAIALRGLRMLGAQHVDYVVPHRMLHGYGLTPALVETIRPAPGLIVTVDNGIASHAGVAAAKARGCKVIVTDHHLPGENLPEADAIVNPNLPDDAFPSKNLCGVGVMFYLLLALRARLRERGVFLESNEPDLTSLLDLVALGTVADLVPLDRNNRALVEAGLRRIRGGRACAGVNALIEVSGCSAKTLSASELGFSIAPRINAAGRLEDMSIGIECLIADDASRAHELATILHGINAERRSLQDGMVADAEEMLEGIAFNNAIGVALFDPGWHAGVVGLVAARVKERLHRPAIAFAPAGEGDPGALRGSARSIAGFHIRDALAEVDAREPGLIVRFGGHAMAAGLSLRACDFDRFARCFDVVARARLAPEALQPLLHSDGELTPDEFDLDLGRQLRMSGPWGQGFPPPLFDNLFECAGWRRMGADDRHLRMQLRDPRDGRIHEAVMFNAESVTPGASAMRVAYELSVNDWQGRESLRLLVRHMEPA